MTNTESNRLDRIEEKIDNLSEAVIAIARAEERLINVTQAVSEVKEESIELEKRIHKLEDIAASIVPLVKLIWIIVGATVLTGVTAIFNILT